MTQTPKYQRCMVLAGGGFRYGIYLGMYDAACEVGEPPDVLLASCGGAIAAALIHSLADPAARRAWLESSDMYHFWCSFRPGPGAQLNSALWGVFKRMLQLGLAPRVPDLFGDYLFELPLAWPPFPTPPSQGTTDIAIIGSRLLFNAEDVGQARGQRKLFQEVVFGSARTLRQLQGATAPFPCEQWGNTAVAATVAIDANMPLRDAVRISVSDMFYFPAYEYGSAHYMGGVVDLLPIELAQRLAHQVLMEFKSEFEHITAVPALRAVLGINGNRRLRGVHAQKADVWIDSSDISAALATEKMQKKIVWRKNRLVLSPPESHAVFARYMQAQWAYGFQRGREAFARKPRGAQIGMRNVNRHNKGSA